MGDNSTKHVGIHIGGTVWHYSNTRKKVVSVPVSQMSEALSRTEG